jgi:hypothetical protein
LKIVYDSGDDVPEAFKSLYTEKDGKFTLTGVEGMKTDTDVAKLNGALTKERNDHKKLRDSIRNTFGIAPTDALPNFDEIKTKLDSVEELQAQVDAAADPKNQKKIDDLVAAKVAAKLAPVERELADTKAKLGEKDKVIGDFETKERTRKIEDGVRSEAIKLKMLDTAMVDANLRAVNLFEEDESGNLVMKEGKGFTQGITVADWLAEQQTKSPHWWPVSQGGGAGGNTGGGKQVNNPWADGSWNLSEQGAIVRTDPAKAAKLAAAAGSKIGATGPTKKK